MAHRELLLARTGMGPDNADIAARRLFDEGPIAAALSVGVAAGLSPRLQPGDLIVGNRVVLYRGSGMTPQNFSCDPGMQEWAMGLLRQSKDRHCLGPIATVERILLTAQEKRHLAAESSAIAVDMESAAIASVAAARAVPFLAIRAILDPLEEDLKIAFGQFLDRQGEPRWAPLTRYLLAHPQVLPRLMALGFRTKVACTRLGRLLRDLLTAPA